MPSSTLEQAPSGLATPGLKQFSASVIPVAVDSMDSLSSDALHSMDALLHIWP